eukprot:CAMPEP_0183832402 /NCGR_PEP_ID=MMETSP0807_2-20130328/5325_1 /TAXON_ID=88271 /ORGANISM="Picocystis salinarum, Strain CCMP1897" /LENGTH=378 /DNA_ID=CAMNT_0026078041 /DNA_START=231 /DNA_END=1364 /DNA_ORIENTATION=-
MDVQQLRNVHAKKKLLGNVAFEAIVELVEMLHQSTTMQAEAPELLKGVLVQCHRVVDCEQGVRKPMDQLFSYYHAAAGHSVLHPLIRQRAGEAARIVVSESSAVLKEEALKCFEGDDVDTLAFLCESRLLEIADLWEDIFIHMLSRRYTKRVTGGFCRMMCREGKAWVPMSNDTRMPLSYACSMSSTKWSLKHIVEELLSQPFYHVDKIDEFQRTALHHACLAKEPDPNVIDLLLHYGAKAQAQDCGGFTPLHFVASRAEYVCCELLLNDCKRPGLLCSNSGKLPLDCLLEKIVHGGMNGRDALAVKTLQLLLESGGQELRGMFLERSCVSMQTKAELCTSWLTGMLHIVLCAYGYHARNCCGLYFAEEGSNYEALLW